MVLAQAVEVNVADDDHLAVAGLEQGVVEQGLGVNLIADEQFVVGAGDAVGRGQQPFACRVFAHGAQNSRHGVGHNALAVGRENRAIFQVAAGVGMCSIKVGFVNHKPAIMP